MKYTNEDIIKIEREIESYIASGKYKVVGMDIFDSIENLSMSDSNKGEYEFTYDLYREYLNMLKELDPNILEVYLATLKTADVIDNQSLEKEDSFMMALYKNIQKTFAIDYLIEHLLNKEILDSNVLKKTHGILLKGTKSEDESFDFRRNNRKFVGHFNGEKRSIHYFPIDYKKADKAGDKLCEIYKNKVNEEYDLFLKPIVMHGLLAALQLFDDGNTRLARLLQHAIILNETNKDNNLGKFNSPTIYATRTYFPHRAEYRSLIGNIAINPDKEAWNNWIKFNLRRFQDQVFVNNEKVKKLERFKK